jgi:sugar phosphate isomerase/epimerase
MPLLIPGARRSGTKPAASSGPTQSPLFCFSRAAPRRWSLAQQSNSPTAPFPPPLRLAKSQELKANSFAHPPFRPPKPQPAHPGCYLYGGLSGDALRGVARTRKPRPPRATLNGEIPCAPDGPILGTQEKPDDAPPSRYNAVQTLLTATLAPTLIDKLSIGPYHPALSASAPPAALPVRLPAGSMDKRTRRDRESGVGGRRPVEASMMRVSACICLIPELSRGPFLYCGDLAESCRRAAEAGFDAVELLPSSADAIDPAQLRDLLTTHGLRLSGIGTGAGFLLHRLHLCSPDADCRRKAVEFAGGIVDLAGPLGGFAVIGSLKGCLEPGVELATALDWLREGLSILGARAERYGVPLIIEPLNRYESSFINRLEEAVKLIRSLDTGNVRLLADLFHMNIEEVSMAAALRAAADHLGHVHFADSNRRAMGFGHTDGAEVGRTLHQIGYDGYLTAEILPYPDADAAARQTIRAFKQCVLAG